MNLPIISRELLPVVKKDRMRVYNFVMKMLPVKPSYFDYALCACFFSLSGCAANRIAQGPDLAHLAVLAEKVFHEKDLLGDSRYASFFQRFADSSLESVLMRLHFSPGRRQIGVTVAGGISDEQNEVLSDDDRSCCDTMFLFHRAHAPHAGVLLIFDGLELFAPGYSVYGQGATK